MKQPASKFAPVIDALLDNDHPFPARMLRDFSDLTPSHLLEIKNIWPSVESSRKISLLEDLENIAESDTLVNFDVFAKFALADPDPAVRVLSIRLLWECEESRLIPTLTEMMISDSAEDVRAAAASALGKFVLMGELESIPDSLRISTIQNLLDVAKGEDLTMVRRRALESLGYSSHQKVIDLIDWAAQQDTQWLISALYAMGRSADDRWSDQVLHHLDSNESEILFEAIRAAGELALEDARDPLLEKLDEEIEDQELRYAIIWSLSQIGGEAVKARLEELMEKSTDDDEADWLEKALDNLELGGDLENMELMGIEGKGHSAISHSNESPSEYDDDEEENDFDDDLLDFDDLEEEIDDDE